MKPNHLFAILALALSFLSINASATGWGSTYPYDGPQYFADSSEGYAYIWTYSGIDNNGCKSCTPYHPSYECGPHTVGMNLKARQPNTRDNDYTYTCTATNGDSFNVLPADGPQYFNNTFGGVAYRWRYVNTDNNGCKSCRPYSPNFLCSRHTVGQTMKARQPGTRDNDYVYECTEEY